MKIKYMPFSQPIGEFALSIMKFPELERIVCIDQRKFDQDSMDSYGGPQRTESRKRINEIANYADTPDATFPTAIILALKDGDYLIEDNYLIINKLNCASIVDGQHRYLGIKQSQEKNNYQLPVVFLLDATEEQKALLFAIINGKQTKVSASLIYDLFGVTEGRNPIKTCHEIARAMNANSNSPYYKKLKMLGMKTPGSNEVLSQGTFVTQLVSLITNNPDEDFQSAKKNINFRERPDCIFNRYFIDGKDEIILKILLNLFNAVSIVFKDEWNSPDNYIISKTTGYTGIIKSLPEIIYKGKLKKDLSQTLFINIFEKVKEELKSQNLKLDSSDFSPGNIGESRLRDIIRKCVKDLA